MKGNRVRVLQLISSGGYYGAENMLLNLCARQEETGCRPSLVLFYNVHVPNVEFYERARRRGISVRMVHCKGRADWHAVGQIKEIIHEDAIDLVHAHGYKADLYGYVAAKSATRPVVATCHNWVGGTAALGLYNRLDRMVLKRFNAVAAVSESVRQQLLGAGLPANKIKVIANGIDVEAFERASSGADPRAGEGKIIGVVARLDLQKGFEFLLLAARELCREFRNLTIVVSGEGPDRGAIEQMIARYGLESNVVLSGQESDMPAVYAAMDLFVLPSLNEGLPMTVLEAMAASRPIVATRVGAIPNVIHEGETGLLVKPADAAGLQAAIARLLCDPELCRHLGAQAHKWVGRNYTSEIMAQQYRSLYDEVLGAKKALSSPQPNPVESAGAEIRRA
jgi:glycosyltransferase involved in cell wall biosynthesis